MPAADYLEAAPQSGERGAVFHSGLPVCLIPSETLVMNLLSS